MKITIEIPDGKYCTSCPCLGLNGKEDDHCGFWDKSLDCKNGEPIRHKYCLDMQKMRQMEVTDGQTTP